MTAVTQTEKSAGKRGTDMLTAEDRKLSVFTSVLSAAVMLMVGVSSSMFAPGAAYGGCGCQKPPPDLASVRPNATYVGAKVTLFSRSFQVGQVYSVDLM